MDFTIAPLQLKDVNLVPSLIRYNMNEDLYPLTIFSSNKYVMYLTNLLRISSNLKNIQYLGAYHNKTLLGFAEWRILEDEIFLNNISLFPSYRGSGIGKALFEQGIILAKAHGKKKISLDVFEDNQYAKNWYKNKGFFTIKTTQWYVGEFKCKSALEKTINTPLQNFPISEAEHSLYGFSMLNIKTTKGIYEVGRIKETIFRLNGLKALGDNELLIVLHKMDPNRSLLILADKEILNNSFHLKGISKRMSLIIN